MGNGKTWRTPDRRASPNHRQPGLRKTRCIAPAVYTVVPRRHRSVSRRHKKEVKSRIVIDLLIRAVAKVVVPLFFLGMAGSLVVIAISFVDDLRELFKDEEKSAP